MDFLGSLFHNIGNFFTGGDNSDSQDPRKRQQQQQQYTPPTPQTQQTLGTLQKAPGAPTAAPPPPKLNLYQSGQLPAAPTLQKATPAPAPTPPAPVQPQPPAQPQPNFLSSVEKTATGLLGNSPFAPELPLYKSQAQGVKKAYTQGAAAGHSPLQTAAELGANQYATPLVKTVGQPIASITGQTYNAPLVGPIEPYQAEAKREGGWKTALSAGLNLVQTAGTVLGAKTGLGTLLKTGKDLTPAADELVTGVKSVNPTAAEDAAKQAQPAQPGAGTPVDVRQMANEKIVADQQQASARSAALEAERQKMIADRQAAVDQANRAKVGQPNVNDVRTGQPPILDTQFAREPGAPRVPGAPLVPADITPRRLTPAPAEVTPPPVAPPTPAPTLPVEAAPALPTPETAVQPTPTAAAEAVAQGNPVAPSLDANGNPALISDITAARQAAGVSPNPTPINPAIVQAAEKAAAPERTVVDATGNRVTETQLIDRFNELSSVPHNERTTAQATQLDMTKSLMKRLSDTPPPDVTANPTMAPNGELKNARFQQAVVDNTRDPVFKAAFESDPIEKNGAPLSQLNEEAVARVQTMSLPELAQHYGQDFEDGHGPITNPSQYYEGLQALKQLEQYAGDPTAAEAAANTLRAINEFANAQGRGLAATRIAYENLPTSMKVAYIQKLVTKGGGELAAADLDRLASAAELQGKFAQTAEQATQAVHELATHLTEADSSLSPRMSALLRAEEAANKNLYEQNGIIVDLLQKNLPKSALGDRLAQNARTAMLSSVGGRGFALTGTGFNTIHHIADNTLSSVYGRGINALNKLRGGTGNEVKTSLIRPTTLAKGAVTGTKGLAKEVYGAKSAKSVEDALNKPYDTEYSHDTTRYGALGKVTAPLRKIGRVMTGSHLAVTKGVETAALEQSARQVAVEQGIPKANMGAWVDYYKSHAPSAVAEEARQQWLAVNNLHKNGISDALGKAASALEATGGKSAAGQLVAKQIRTTVIPFSRFMGGFLHKMLTDRNLAYNAFRIVKARSPQELSDQLAHATTNIGMGAGLGYLLAKSGTITDKDQDGNSYDGLYFHIGNRYIPIGWAGQAAMPIIMGSRLQMSKNPGDYAANVANDIFKTAGVAGTFGSDSGVGSVFNGDTGRGVPQTVGTSIRQHVPGIFGDINSVLNRSGLNPTNEKPLTKATTTNPATGNQVTDVGQTEINKTKAAIPFLSQQMPRQPGELAPSLIDRMLHAGESSSTQVQAAKDQKVQQDQSASDKANDIPDPHGKYDSSKGESFDGAVNAKIANNEYDKAITALQQKQAVYQGDTKVDPKTVKSLTNHIKELGVTKQFGNSGQDVRQLYLGTTLAEWRAMGDPNSDTYDPNTYKQLWGYDSQLAGQGVAGASSSEVKGKFYAKKASAGSAGAAGRRSVMGNTIGDLHQLQKINFGNLAPAKVSAQIPTVLPLKSTDLIKPRTITVSKVK